MCGSDSLTFSNWFIYSDQGGGGEHTGRTRGTRWEHALDRMPVHMHNHTPIHNWGNLSYPVHLLACFFWEGQRKPEDTEEPRRTWGNLRSGSNQGPCSCSTVPLLMTDSKIHPKNMFRLD